jgi:hypothetical protein
MKYQRLLDQETLVVTGKMYSTKQPDHEAIYLTVISKQIAISTLWSEQSKRLGAHNLSGKQLRRISV